MTWRAPLERAGVLKPAPWIVLTNAREEVCAIFEGLDALDDPRCASEREIVLQGVRLIGALEVEGFLYILDAKGRPMASLELEDARLEPSLDAVRCTLTSPLGPPGTVETLRRWRAHPPDALGLWVTLTQEERVCWWQAAYRRCFARWWGDPRPGDLDRARGALIVMDGQHIRDRLSFFIALGEAINGPGGFFGGHHDGLADCLTGGFGITPPFTLRILNSAPMRTALPAWDLAQLVEIFDEVGVTMRWA